MTVALGDSKPQDHGRDWLLQQHPGAGVYFDRSGRTLPVRSALPAALDGGRGNFLGRFRTGAQLATTLFGSRKCDALT